MTTIDIAGTPHRITDFKNEFTPRQLKRALTLLAGLLHDHGTIASLLRSGKATGDQLIALLTEAPDIVNDTRLYQLMAVFFLPVGAKYDDSQVEERAKVMEDAPIGLLVEAVKGFFRGKTTASESSTDTLTPSTP